MINYPKVSAKQKEPANPLSPDPLIRYKWENPKATNGLERYHLLPKQINTPDHTSFNIKDFKKHHVITINGQGSIRFDFGSVSAGWLEFESDDMTDSIAMSISEYNEPAVVNAGAVNPVKTKAPVKYGNTYRLELNPELYEGVRFGWLHVLKHNRSWQLKNLRLVCQVKPVNYQGSFSSSDPELTKIWYTGAYTVKLNLQKDYFGAILMERSDRHSWTGDAYPSQAAAMVAFGNYDFVKANIINTSGLNNGIASYSLYWVLSLIDYISYTGDTDFAAQYLDNAIEKLDIAFRQFGKKPSLGFYGWDERLGAGFENPNIPESQYAYSMLSIRAWNEFGYLMKMIGKKDLAEKYIGYAISKMAEIRKQDLWLTNYGLHAAADAINTGLTNKKEEDIFYSRNFSDRINRLSYSPFNQYFILNAMSKSGHYEDALSSIKDYWGGQLRQGATTFYEVYRPSWNNAIGENGAPPNNQCGYTSLTHPWSAGVVKWLSEEVLGIKPLEPGFKTFQVKPHMGKSLTAVAGSTPTLYGLISASFNVKSGIAKLSIPRGTITQQLFIPLSGNKIKSLTINGKSADDYQTKQEEGHLIINNLHPGTYLFNISYQKKNTATGKIEQQKWSYSIPKFHQDSLTAGNWSKKYGKDGYVLFNYEKAGEHLEELPHYLGAITLKNQANFHLKSLDQNDKLLTNNQGKTAAFGAIITQDPNPTAQSITIDLPIKDGKEHQIALYFLDYDHQNRRSAIEVFDMDNLKILSPVEIIRGYTNGKYLVFKYTGSIRIRINQLRGKNAALSGLFFDPAK